MFLGNNKNIPKGWDKIETVEKRINKNQMGDKAKLVQKTMLPSFLRGVFCKH